MSVAVGQVVGLWSPSSEGRVGPQAAIVTHVYSKDAGEPVLDLSSGLPVSAHEFRAYPLSSVQHMEGAPDGSYCWDYVGEEVLALPGAEAAIPYVPPGVEPGKGPQG